MVLKKISPGDRNSYFKMVLGLILILEKMIPGLILSWEIGPRLKIVVLQEDYNSME